MNTDAIKDFINQLLSATPEMISVFCLIALGYGLKLVPQLPNKFIPTILLIIAIGCYPLIADNGKAPYTMRFPIVRQMMMAVVLWFIAWGVHGVILKRWLDKLMPKNGTGDTKFFPKDNPPEPPKPTAD